MTIYLIRHGESKQNTSPFVINDCDDSNLTENGKTQAKRLKHFFSGIKVDKVYTSTLLRSLETANIIFSNINNNIIQLNTLNELNKGFDKNKFKTLTRTNWLSIHKEKMGLWPSKHRKYPHGESLIMLEYRIMKTFYKLISDCNNKKTIQNICIVAHNGTVKTILCSLLGSVDLLYDKINIKHGSVSVIKYDENKFTIESIGS